MRYSNATVLLAPRVLNTRKPLEHKSFIDLYTEIEGEYSKGFIYLLYKFDTVKEFYYINSLLRDNIYYYNYNNIVINKISYTLFRFKLEIKEIEEYKSCGNFGFILLDYTKIFTFWGDLNSEIAYISENNIYDCFNKLKIVKAQN